MKNRSELAGRISLATTVTFWFCRTEREGREGVKRELEFALFRTGKLYCTGTGIRVEDFAFGNWDLGQR